MAEVDERNVNYYLTTPTVESVPLSKLAGFTVFLKLENLQPPGSFKIRGISHFCKKAVNERGCKRLMEMQAWQRLMQHNNLKHRVPLFYQKVPQNL
ncbi:hypothetical protein SNE40_003838 [Patella caerulea]|uniref:L-serine ammonia-lyase n=1 Tax=Patella caerulea TaxID=87958 RepID=A0AAN8KEZ3_PATCE